MNMAHQYGVIDITAFVPLRSPAIKAVQYAPKFSFIQFVHGGVYAVKNLRKSTMTRLINSQHPGRFFHQNIWDKYTITKVEEKEIA